MATENTPNLMQGKEDFKEKYKSSEKIDLQTIIIQKIKKNLKKKLLKLFFLSKKD